MRKAYLHYGEGSAPRHTIETRWREFGRGLYRKSAYRSPTRFQVKHNGRWMRVFANIGGKLFIGAATDHIARVQFVESEHA